MNNILENPAQCELCEEFMQVEDALVICPDCFAYAQNVPPWHPIEKAPKNGTQVLLWNKKSGLKYVGSWRKGYPGSLSGHVPGEPCQYEFHWRSHNGTWADPTHWMPLP